MKLGIVIFATAAGLLAATPPPTLILPAGTPLRIQLETALSSGDAQTGDSFAGRVAQTVYLDGRIAVPAGSIVEGRVSLVRDRQPVAGVSALYLRPDFLSLPDGRHYTISAEVTATNAATGVHVDDEGMIEGSRKPNVEDARRAAVAGASGLITGVVLAGAKGALIGSVMGGAFAGGWWLFTHRHATLNQGAELDIRLDRALRLIPANGAYRPASAEPAAGAVAPRASLAPRRARPAAPVVEAAPPAVPKPKVVNLTPYR